MPGYDAWLRCLVKMRLVKMRLAEMPGRSPVQRCAFTLRCAHEVQTWGKLGSTIGRDLILLSQGDACPIAIPSLSTSLSFLLRGVWLRLFWCCAGHAECKCTMTRVQSCAARTSDIFFRFFMLTRSRRSSTANAERARWCRVRWMARSSYRHSEFAA